MENKNRFWGLVRWWHREADNQSISSSLSPSLPVQQPHISSHRHPPPATQGGSPKIALRQAKCNPNGSKQAQMDVQLLLDHPNGWEITCERRGCVC